MSNTPAEQPKQSIPTESGDGQALQAVPEFGIGRVDPVTAYFDEIHGTPSAPAPVDEAVAKAAYQGLSEDDLVSRRADAAPKHSARYRRLRSGIGAVAGSTILYLGAGPAMREADYAFGSIGGNSYSTAAAGVKAESTSHDPISGPNPVTPAEARAEAAANLGP
ncbi:MAG: hypothetical protein ACHQT9_00645 [Candidatus Saccharimonadales bacterium]